jgi:AcrR family transcriptional regulator
VTAVIGLRQRKKTETRRAIAAVALQLAIEHGPDAITVDDIAAAADVSSRTVFNHFGTKDEAILGIDPERRAELAADVLARPASEPPLDALRSVLADAMTGADDVGRLWLARARLLQDHPQLRSAQLVSQSAFEQALAEVVAARTGMDAERDTYPRLVVATALAALRVALAGGAGGNRRRLRQEIDTVFGLLADGLSPTSRGSR